MKASLHMLNDQKKIWDHFQGMGVGRFDQATPRLTYLFARARRLVRGRTVRALNIGTGSGWMERACAGNGWLAYTLDPSQIAVRGLQAHSIPGQVGLIERSAYQSAAFDIIFSSEVFEHLSARQLSAGLCEITRMLRPGGYLIGSVPFDEDLANGETICPHCGELFHRWGHQQSFTAAAMRALLADAGLQTLEAGARAFPYFPQPSLVDRAKTVVVKAIGRLGFPSAYPSLYFIARKGRG